MNHTLGFFTFKKGISPGEIREFYSACINGKAPKTDKDPVLDSFHSRLKTRFPQFSEISKEKKEKCPWASDFNKGDQHLVVSITFSKAKAIGYHIWALLQEHKLLVYDPQADKAYYGAEELPET